MNVEGSEIKNKVVRLFVNSGFLVVYLGCLIDLTVNDLLHLINALRSRCQVLIAILRNQYVIWKTLAPSLENFKDLCTFNPHTPNIPIPPQHLLINKPLLLLILEIWLDNEPAEINPRLNRNHTTLGQLPPDS